MSRLQDDVRLVLGGRAGEGFCGVVALLFVIVTAHPFIRDFVTLAICGVLASPHGAVHSFGQGGVRRFLPVKTQLARLGGVPLVLPRGLQTQGREMLGLAPPLNTTAGPLFRAKSPTAKELLGGNFPFGTSALGYFHPSPGLWPQGLWILGGRKGNYEKPQNLHILKRQLRNLHSKLLFLRLTPIRMNHFPL